MVVVVVVVVVVVLAGVVEDVVVVSPKTLPTTRKIIVKYETMLCSVFFPLPGPRLLVCCLGTKMSCGSEY